MLFRSAGPDGREIGVLGIRLAWIDGDDKPLEALVAEAEVGGYLAGGGHVDSHSCVGGEHEVAGGTSGGHEACQGGGEREGAFVHVGMSDVLVVIVWNESVACRRG